MRISLLVAFALLVITKTGYCSSKAHLMEEIVVNNHVADFVQALSHIKLRAGELFANEIDNKYKSSYWSDVTDEELKQIDTDFVNTPFLALAKLNGGTFIQSEVKDNLACVFMENNGVIGAFSLVYEKRWKFMSPSVYWSEQKIPKICSALKFEIGLKDERVFRLN